LAGEREIWDLGVYPALWILCRISICWKLNWSVLWLRCCCLAMWTRWYYWHCPIRFS